MHRISGLINRLLVLAHPQLSRLRQLSQRRLVRLGIVVLAGLWFWHIVPWGSVIGDWSKVGLPIAAIALTAALLSAVMEIVSWGIWLPEPGVKRWLRLCRYFASGLFINQFIPTGTASDVWRWNHLSKRHSRQRVFTSLAVTRGLMFFSLIVWVAIAVSILPASLKQPTILSLGIAGVVLGVGALLAISTISAMPWHRGLVSHAHALWIKVVDSGILRSRRRWILSLLTAGLSWGFLIFGISVFAVGMGVHLSWAVATMALIVSLALSWIPWTPNGVGARDGAFVLVLWHAGVHVGTAIALSIFVDFSMLPLALGGGLLLLWYRKHTPAEPVVASAVQLA